MATNIWGEEVLDSKNDSDQNSVLYKDSVNDSAVNDTEKSEQEKIEECKCENEIDIDVMINLIYFIRNKQAYRTYKERFFDYGAEYIDEIRVDTGKKLTESRSEISKFVNELNKVFNKYNINTCLRKIHFLAQSYLETMSFRSTYENRTTVPDNYMGGVDFQGRGIKQITHDYNYLAYYDYVNSTSWHKDIYEKYRVRIKINNKERYESVGEFINGNPKAAEYDMDEAFYNNLKIFAKELSQNLFNAFDSAGWYVAIYKNGLSYMDQDDVEGLTRLINGGTNNLQERKEYTQWLKEYFGYSKNCK